MNEDALVDYCKKHNILLNALIELTNKCNLSCQHCYINHNSSYIPFDIIINIVKKFKDEGTMYVALTGGEVFTHPDFIEIYKLFKTNGFIVTIKTNGLLINDKHIKLFKDYPPAQVNITVYGLNNNEYFEFCGHKYGYTSLVKLLEIFLRNNIRFSLVTIADKFHYPRIINSDYSNFFKKYNRELECNYDLYNTNEGSDKPITLRINNEQIIEIENEKFRTNNTIFSNTNPISNTTQLSCRGGICNFTIDSECNISVCLMDNKKIKLDLENLTYTKKWLAERNKEIEQMFKESKCFCCKEAFLCQKCPLWHKRTVSKNTNNRCELAKMKKSFIMNLQA